MLTFSASYCAPCKDELKRLAELNDQIAKANLVVAPVIIDTDDEGRGAMLELVKRLGVKFPVLVDRYGILARRYRADSLPYTVVVGASGKIEKVHTGFDRGALDALLSELGVKL